MLILLHSPRKITLVTMELRGGARFLDHDIKFNFKLLPKFTTKNLDEVNFINYGRNQIQIIYNCKKIRNQDLNFVRDWDVILEHFQVT